MLTSFGAEELAERAGALLDDPVRLARMREDGPRLRRREHDRARLRDALAETLEQLERGLAEEGRQLGDAP